MQINFDFNERVILETEQMEWIPSPLAGVSRRMLDRQAAESGRATSIVRYEPDSFFSPHTHTGGEEFLVLDGVFSDEMGDFGPGMYVRNPVGSKHKPHSKDGCTIFVKLGQMDPDDREFVRIDTTNTAWLPGKVDGLSVMPLHSFGPEKISLLKWAPGTKSTAHQHSGGEEIYVIDGILEDEHGKYPKGTWLRSPEGTDHLPFSTEGCTIYVKTGHLPKDLNAQLKD